MSSLWPLALGLVAFSALGTPLVPPSVLFLTAGALAIAWICATVDGWAGALAGYIVLRWLYPPLPYGYETAMYFTFGVLFLCGSRSMPRYWFGLNMDACVRWMVVGLGVVQIVMALLQWAGHDPIFLPMQNSILSHGLTGNSNFLGAYLAITVALAPAWLLPLWGLGLLASHCVLGTLAASVALGMRYWTHWRILLPVFSVGLVGIGVEKFRVTGFLWQSLEYRAAINLSALNEWWRHAPVFGFGPGGFFRSQFVTSLNGVPQEIYHQAHNEYLQLAFDGGMVSVLLLAGWLICHRRAFLTRQYGPCLCAIAVDALGMFPFQVPCVALLCLLLIGRATRREIKHGEQARVRRQFQDSRDKRDVSGVGADRRDGAGKADSRGNGSRGGVSRSACHSVSRATGVSGASHVAGSGTGTGPSGDYQGFRDQPGEVYGGQRGIGGPQCPRATEELRRRQVAEECSRGLVRIVNNHDGGGTQYATAPGVAAEAPDQS